MWQGIRLAETPLSNAAFASTGNVVAENELNFSVMLLPPKCIMSGEYHVGTRVRYTRAKKGDSFNREYERFS
jgi:hypothetical protein